AKKIINLLLLNNNFYPVIIYRRIQKEINELLCTVWSLVMVRGISCQHRSNNFYPVIYRRVQKESDELLCTVWSLVMVRESVVNAR
ncbi:unnamed protein product, partial [Heterotrigona itama]